MFSRKRFPVSDRGTDSAVGGDFCRVLESEIESLYLLAFLLTANHAQAERCLRSVIGEVLEEKRVFKGAVSRWIRRCLIKLAVGSVSAVSDRSTEMADLWWEEQPAKETAAMINAVTKLVPLDRFVFVMSVLERYSVKECSLLLNCTVARVFDARVSAFRQLGSFQAQVVNEVAQSFNLLGGSHSSEVAPSVAVERKELSCATRSSRMALLQGEGFFRCPR